MSWDLIITAAVSVLGSGGITALVATLLKSKHEERKDGYGWANAIIRRLEARVVVLEQKNEQCQRENAELREKLGRLEEAVRRLEGQK